MKTNRAMLFLVLLCVTLVQNAQAFYNPSTGRWLSRDPIEEKGGKNLYGFNYNDPIQFYDKDGRHPAAVALIGAVFACAMPQHNESFKRFPDSGDKFKHCWVSCRISKTCGGLIAELAGLGKEAKDRAVGAYCELFPDSEICKGGQGDFMDSIDDIAANQQCIGWESLAFGAPGGWIGSLCRQSCEDCCKAKVGYNAGKP